MKVVKLKIQEKEIPNYASVKNYIVIYFETERYKEKNFSGIRQCLYVQYLLNASFNIQQKTLLNKEIRMDEQMNCQELQSINEEANRISIFLFIM